MSTSEAELFAFKYTRVARCPEINFRDTGTFSYFLLCPCSSVILNDVTFNNAIYRARAPREGLNKDKGAGYSTTIGKGESRQVTPPLVGKKVFFVYGRTG